MSYDLMSYVGDLLMVPELCKYRKLDYVLASLLSGGFLL